MENKKKIVLKAREARIFEYIKEYLEINGYPPTVRDICKALDIKSTSTVQSDINSLTEKGLIKKNAGHRRAMRIVDDGSSAASAGKQAAVSAVQGEAAQTENHRDDIVDIPVIGNVAAGTPILAEQNIEEHIPVPERFARGKNTFLLKVRGESMINVGIFDGDYIIVEQCSDAQNGEIVVAAISGFDSEATVKTFYREGDHIRLQPENDDMMPIIVKDVKIQGKVKGVFRYF